MQSSNGELNIYNKMGGGEKYREMKIVHQNGGSFFEDDNKDEETITRDRIQRLEEKIDTLQKELNKLKKK